LSLAGKGRGDRGDNNRGVTLLSVPGKVFARIILDRVGYHLLGHQCPEQSGFTPKKSTIDYPCSLGTHQMQMRVLAGAAHSLCLSPQSGRFGELECTLEYFQSAWGATKIDQSDF